MSCVRQQRAVNLIERVWRDLLLVVELVAPPVVRVVPLRIHGQSGYSAGWLATARPEINSCSKHADPPFKLHFNRKGRPAGQPAPSPPCYGSAIRYISTSSGAGREGYYNPHINLRSNSQ